MRFDAVPLGRVWCRMYPFVRSYIRRGMPLPVVLDTSCVRTGLHYQLVRGEPPFTVATAKNARTRFFMELDTCREMWRKLPKFAADLGVEVADLVEILNRDWLPYIRVVQLP